MALGQSGTLRNTGRGGQGTYGFFKVGNKVITVLVLFQTSKGHLRSRDVLESQS